MPGEGSGVRVAPAVDWARLGRTEITPWAMSGCRRVCCPWRATTQPPASRRPARFWSRARPASLDQPSAGSSSGAASTSGLCTGRPPPSLRYRPLPGSGGAAAREAGARRLVLTSSVAALGVPRGGRPLTEADTYNLRPGEFPYGYGKFMSEREALERGGDSLEVVIVNPSVVLGPGDAHQISGSLVIEAARGRAGFWMDGGINLVHVADVAEGDPAAVAMGRPGERDILGGENSTNSEGCA